MTFTQTWNFSKPWRPYQARVLSELDEAFENQRAHIVAAPGSGKTVLGLEITRRLAKPALVLTPTITVREQWVERLKADFLSANSESGKPTADPEWISSDLATPGSLTVATYQSLSAAHKKPGGRERIRKALAKVGFGTLVVDEAHHLRGHWWTCLGRLREDFPELKIVALTATPPYDVPQVEWNRYSQLCGPVDAEISAPELVRENNLCPHQDYIYFSEPTGEELREVEKYDTHRDRVLTELRSMIECAECLSKHPLFTCGLPSRKQRLAELDWFLAVVLYIREVGGKAPVALEDALELKGVDLPDLDLHWLQIFLQGLLITRGEDMGWYPPMVPFLAKIRRLLQDIGAIEKGQVLLMNSKINRRLLAGSPSKIAAVADILEAEIESLHVGMRAVVLADYIRDEVLGTDGLDDRPFEKLGVAPIFEAIRRRRIPMMLPAILTGRLVIVPKSALGALKSALPDLSTFTSKPLPVDSEFAIINVDDGSRHKIVRAVTQVFESGEVNALIGTAALLGEGWDAPATNTLVLASSVGSFMSSNQMRGRAIRCYDGDTDKAANIWHLACVAGTGKGVGAEDFIALERRFSSYAGISLKDEPPSISEGIQRMGLPETRDATEAIAQNAQTLRIAINRIDLRKRWKDALPSSPRDRFRPIREVIIRHPSLAVRIGTRASWLGKTPVIGGIFERIAHRRAIRNRMSEVRGYAKALLGALEEIRPFTTTITERDLILSIHRSDIIVRLDVECSVDQRRFAKAITELFEVLRQPTPRYLLRSKGRWFAVPAEIDGHKSTATAFLVLWKKHVRRRKVELVYAHGDRGHAATVEARRDALVGRFDWTSAAQTRWHSAGAALTGESN